MFPIFATLISRKNNRLKMLDKNTIIGLVLIFAVFIGYGILTSPSEQEREAMKIKQDSLREVQQKINLENNEKQIINSTSQINSDSSIVNQFQSG